jgi:[ribosomal protein S5]-alanine N-acetyltransferase
VPRLIPPAIADGTLARIPQPVIELSDCALRPWVPVDAPAVAAAYATPDIQRWHVRSMTDDEAREWIGSWSGRWQQGSDGGWAIARGRVLLGQISLRRLDLLDGLGHLSYWVVPQARGHGVASRALRALSAWAFDHLGLHRLEVSHSLLNRPSCRVAENAGYRLEGTKRSEALHADGWHDMHLHARLADDARPGD